MPRAILVQWKMTKRNSSSSLLNFPLNHDGGRITKDKREGLHWNPMFCLDKTWFLHFWATQVQRVLRFFEVSVDFILHTASSWNKKGRENHGSMVHITIDSSIKQIEKLPNKKTVSLHCRFVPQRHLFQKLPLHWYHFFAETKYGCFTHRFVWSFRRKNCLAKKRCFPTSERLGPRLRPAIKGLWSPPFVLLAGPCFPFGGKRSPFFGFPRFFYHYEKSEDDAMDFFESCDVLKGWGL